MLTGMQATNIAASYDYLLQTAQILINSGADPAEVETIVSELAPLYDLSPPKFQKQDIFQIDQPPMAAAASPRIELPSARELPWYEDALIGAALYSVPPLGATVTAARVMAASTGRTIGIGPQISGGFGAGGSLGAGLLITNQGKLGAYGSVGGAAGLIASISLTLQFTIVGGGVEVFGGTCLGVGIGGGEIVAGNMAALISLDSRPRFIGISVGGGVGVGIPFEVFVTAQHTWTT